jgi:hypothetical protein
MNVLNPLVFVSVEGCWEKSVHDARVAEAAEKLLKNENAFAIATATHAPSPSISFTDIALGKYTAHALINEYNISPRRVLPAYLFNQKTTYTIIDAYSNAIMIGWLSCGLSQSSKLVKVDLYPVTAGFIEQGERIVLINTRALRVLSKLSVDTVLHEPPKIEESQLSIGFQEEAEKLEALKIAGGVIQSGSWIGYAGIKRSFDNIEAMHGEIVFAMKRVFGAGIKTKELFCLSDVERLLLSMVWSVKSNTGVLRKKDWTVVSNAVGSYFINEIEDAVIASARDKLASIGIEA